MTPERQREYSDALEGATRSELLLTRMERKRASLLAALAENGFSLMSKTTLARVHSTPSQLVLLSEATVWDAHARASLTARAVLELSRDPADFGYATAYWEVRRLEKSTVPGRRDALSLVVKPLYTAGAIAQFRRASNLASTLVSHLREHDDLADERWEMVAAQAAAQELLTILAP